MNRILVDVPDEKMKAFEEAMRDLGIERTADTNFEIPEEHKNIVRRIIAESKPEDYRNWREAFAEIRNKFNEDRGK